LHHRLHKLPRVRVAEREVHVGPVRLPCAHWRHARQAQQAAALAWVGSGAIGLCAKRGAIGASKKCRWSVSVRDPIRP
jgi:hypothetical protein